MKLTANKKNIHTEHQEKYYRYATHTFKLPATMNKVHCLFQCYLQCQTTVIYSMFYHPAEIRKWIKNQLCKKIRVLYTCLFPQHRAFWRDRKYSDLKRAEMSHWRRAWLLLTPKII